MKAYGGEDIQLHAFFNWHYMEWSLNRRLDGLQCQSEWSGVVEQNLLALQAIET
jgi:hypothetical protein